MAERLNDCQESELKSSERNIGLFRISNVVRV